MCAKGDVSFSEMIKDDGTALLLNAYNGQSDVAHYVTVTADRGRREHLITVTISGGSSLCYHLPTLRTVHVHVDGRARRWREKHRYICLFYALALTNGY
jgi:hypothetical protein